MKRRVFPAAAAALGTMLVATPVLVGNNGWSRDNRGWWYQFSNGSYARSSWVSVNNSWYFADASGYVQTGWLSDRSGQYYLDTNNGDMCMGWVNVNGDQYYMNPANGDRMLANGYVPDGYYANGDGMYRPDVGTTQSGGQDNNQSSRQNSMQLPKAQLEDQVIKLINQERAKQGISPIKKDAGPTSTAGVCVVELEALLLYDRPDGLDRFTAYPGGFGYKGENVVAGQRNPEEVMDSWMYSNGHRTNILNPNYDSIGVGHSSLNGGANRVQNFGKKNSGWN